MNPEGNPKENLEENLQKLLSSVTNIERTVCSPYPEVQHIPRDNEEQVSCNVRCIVITVGDIDTVKQEFDAEIYLSLRWKEEKYNGKEQKDIDWTNCWDPRVYFPNAVNITKNERQHILREHLEDAAVQLTIRMKATFKTAMQLRNFPLDYQELTIKLMSNWPENVVKFEKEMQWPDLIRTDTFTGQHEWTLHKHLLAAPGSEEADVRHKHYPKYNISIHVERKFWYYIWNIAIVIFLLVALNFTCLSVRASDPASRLGVTLTLLLTSVAFKLVVSSTLPTISYLTRLDIYVLLSLIWQCLFVAQNSIAVIFDHRNISEQLDYVSGGILGLLALVLNLGFIICGVVVKFKAKKKLKEFTNGYNYLCDGTEAGEEARNTPEETN